MIHQKAQVAADVAVPLDADVGPFVVIERGVTVGAGSTVGPFVYVAAGLSIGARAHIHPHALIYADVPDGGEVGPAEVWVGEPTKIVAAPAMSTEQVGRAVAQRIGRRRP